jgi:dipeptidyl aminopeptidase/acylaminoacyl peptidase
MKSRRTAATGSLSVTLLILLASVCGTSAQTVSVKEGNIYWKGSGAARQLTTSGHDSDPSLSPDGHSVVFVRGTPGKMISHGAGEDEATELWLIDVDGKNATMLLRGKEDPEPKAVLVDMNAPQFSPDGKKIYFVSAAWATSGAVHVYDLQSKQQKFLCPGNDLHVVRTGDYKGHLLVTQHRYFIGGGSYDWFWLLKPDGSEVGAVGEDTKNFRELYEK